MIFPSFTTAMESPGMCKSRIRRLMQSSTALDFSDCEYPKGALNATAISSAHLIMCACDQRELIRAPSFIVIYLEQVGEWQEYPTEQFPHEIDA